MSELMTRLHRMFPHNVTTLVLLQKSIILFPKLGSGYTIYFNNTVTGIQIAVYSVKFKINR